MVSIERYGTEDIVDKQESMVNKMMKLTKKGLVLLAMLVLITATMYGALAAPPLPYPIYGKVLIIGNIMPLLDAKLTLCEVGSSMSDCIEGEQFDFQTDTTGSYIFAMDNLNPMYRTHFCTKTKCYDGDFVKIKVCDNHPNCEVIQELKGTALEVNFDVGSNVKPIEPAVVTIEKEKIVYVPEKNDKGEDVVVVIADEPTSVEALKALWARPWFKGFLAMIVILLGAGGAWAVKAYKMAKTTVAKNKKGLYK